LRFTVRAWRASSSKRCWRLAFWRSRLGVPTKR
jgi:hypothetical protein